MITLKCNIEEGKTIVLDCLNKKLYNGSEIEIENKLILESEIQFLLSRGFLEKTNSKNEEAEDDGDIDIEEYQMFKVFLCKLKEHQRITFDSIKGTIHGGKLIKINSNDLKNNDVEGAIKSGILEEYVEELSDEVVEDAPEDKSEESNNVPDVKISEGEDGHMGREMYDEGNKNPNDISLDTSIEAPHDNNAIMEKDETHHNNNEILELDIKEISIKESVEEKEEQPKFRVPDGLKDSFSSIGQDMYETEAKEEVAPAPKKGRGRPKGSKNKTTAKAKTTTAPKKGRGRPKGSKNKTTVKEK